MTPLDTEIHHRVSENLVLPDMVNEERPELLFNREFTRMGRFGSIIQATYLSNLVSGHVTGDSQDPVSRDTQARNLDASLHSFCSVLIPPPGKTDDLYDGAFAIRTK
jgi:hypothetical protein